MKIRPREWAIGLLRGFRFLGHSPVSFLAVRFRWRRYALRLESTALVCPSQSRLSSLWWSLHHSNDADRMAVVIDCYLDESGTDDQSPTAVVGGLLLQRDSFFCLDIEWKKALERHGINPPLHMKEFGPHGKFKNIPHDTRRLLFSDLVKIINEHKTGTIAATLTTAQYDRHFSGLFRRKDMGVYGFCFILLVMIQAKSAQEGGITERIPFVMDIGNPYRHHVLEAHASIEYVQKSQFLNAGSLTFDCDTNLRALQAADLVSWSVRRKLTGAFVHGFEPLPEVFASPHIEQPYEEEWLKTMADNLRALRDQSPEVEC